MMNWVGGQMMNFPQQRLVNTVTRRFGPRAAAYAVTGMLLFSAQSAFAAPYNYYYFLDAQATNTGIGSSDADVIFATPLTGVEALSFTQASQTLTATGGNASASTTFSASIAAGVLGATSVST